MDELRDHKEEDFCQLRSKPKRPSNAFLLFCKEARASYAWDPAGGKALNNRKVSKKLGSQWARMTPEQKQPFEEEAARLMTLAREENPGWKFGYDQQWSFPVSQHGAQCPSRLRPRERVGFKLPSMLQIRCRKNRQQPTEKELNQSDSSASGSPGQDRTFAEASSSSRSFEDEWKSTVEAGQENKPVAGCEIEGTRVDFYPQRTAPKVEARAEPSLRKNNRAEGRFTSKEKRGIATSYWTGDFKRRPQKPGNSSSTRLGKHRRLETGNGSLTRQRPREPKRGQAFESESHCPLLGPWLGLNFQKDSVRREENAVAFRATVIGDLRKISFSRLPWPRPERVTGPLTDEKMGHQIKECSMTPVSREEKIPTMLECDKDENAHLGTGCSPSSDDENDSLGSLKEHFLKALGLVGKSGNFK